MWDVNNSSQSLNPSLTYLYADAEEGERGEMMMIVSIIGPITTRGEGGLNKRGRRKILDICGDNMDRTHTRR